MRRPLSDVDAFEQPAVSAISLSFTPTSPPRDTVGEGTTLPHSHRLLDPHGNDLAREPPGSESHRRRWRWTVTLTLKVESTATIVVS
jgi:hypothetical protein